MARKLIRQKQPFMRLILALVWLRDKASPPFKEHSSPGGGKKQKQGLQQA
ncbi:hypothetical protein AA15669_0552 [Saccharibacter floricola DSM 15669]|uniref:Transposase n=1 Tax=Saccharibacter floricola DSM 15669 TaxID=1123227 RepID=A0ABQ0NX66_9PROT|nr:hypothetical protein AA15669_0552 [Saccharibacter floricola DSM 15669]